ncbi:MAG: hypothetical protein ACR2N2_08395 [Acidimicrobiia bacterium]
MGEATLIELEAGIEDEIQQFVAENWDFFARWDSGQIPTDRIEWLHGREVDDRLLVNDQIPGAIETKDGFATEFLSMHGRFADDPVSARIDLLFAGKLAPDVYVVTYRQHYDASSGRSTNRVITEVLVRKDGALRVQYIHE